MTREQLYIDGTAPSHYNPHIEEALRAWQDAQGERKSAGERVKTRHATLISRVIEAGIESYPFTDASGRKRQIVAPAVRRVRVMTVRGAGGGKANGKRTKAEPAADVAAPAVPESSDPFAAARRAVDDRDREADAAPAAPVAGSAFSIGDRVTWKSQAGGNWTTKTGAVVEVVPAKRGPKKIRSESRRDHVSFVIDVDGEIYWPIASRLKLAKGKR